MSKVDIEKIHRDIDREAMTSDALIDWIYKAHKLRPDNDLREWLAKCGRLHYCPQRMVYVIRGMAGSHIGDILYSAYLITLHTHDTCLADFNGLSLTMEKKP